MTLKITKIATASYGVTDDGKPVAFIYFQKDGERATSYIQRVGSAERTRLNYVFLADIKRDLSEIVNA
jgi:hypothetical protein